LEVALYKFASNLVGSLFSSNIKSAEDEATKNAAKIEINILVNILYIYKRQLSKWLENKYRRFAYSYDIMASLYIQQNNQNLLWKIINNTPQMIQFFYDSSPGEKEKWFQNVIRHVYNSHHSNVDVGLRDLNKITIDFMLEMLQKAQIRSGDTMSLSQSQSPQQQYQQQPSLRSVETMSLPPSPQQQYQQQPQPPSLQTKPKQVQTDAIENQFAIRRQEYENMTKKTVPVPSFTENVKDEAISDIGSVVNEYMKQREQDMKQFIAEKPNNNNNKIQIMNEENISINVEELESPLSLRYGEPTNKKVKWGENTEHVYVESVPLPIENLGEKILNAINKLSEKIDKLTVEQSQRLLSHCDNNELLKKLVKE
jgi:hypothetical protein